MHIITFKYYIIDWLINRNIILVNFIKKEKIHNVAAKFFIRDKDYEKKCFIHISNFACAIIFLYISIIISCAMKDKMSNYYSGNQTKFWFI